MRYFGVRFLFLAILILAGCHRAEPPAKTEEREAAGSTPVSSRQEFLDVARRLEESRNPYLGITQVEETRRRLNAPGLRQQHILDLHLELCWHLLRLGRTKEAVREIEVAFELAKSQNGAPGGMMKRVHELRAVVYLRQAETDNCINRHNKECCIFPLRGGGVHSSKEPARKARESLLALLQQDPDDLSSRWLLNVVSMALGEHPRGVPPKFLIPTGAFQSQYDVGRFEDIAPRLGVDTFNLCGGAIVDDFNGDGRLDIVTSTFDPRGPLTLYGNQEGHKFRDESTESYLDRQLGGLNCIAADYDNDGFLDILVLRGAWLLDDGRIRNSLLHNNGDGTFTDVTHEAGLAVPAFPTQAAAWGDFDNDGDLDLYVGNESRRSPTNQTGDFPSQLFRNNGDGTFSDVAKEAGVTNDRYAKGVSVGDYDNDGDLDIYVSNSGVNRLYRNDGNLKFTDVADELRVTQPIGRSFATWFFDYDNDGRLDLFVAAFEAKISDIAADYLGQPHRGVSPCLYRNLGKQGFRNIARTAGLGHPYLPMGANFGDLDNDGFLDIYLATGDPDFRTLTPGVMLRNDRGKSFQNVTTAGGFGHLQKGHGVAFADFDDDGDQDIYVQLGGFYPGDRFHNALFQNPGHGNHSLIIELVGTETNRKAVGARIAVTVDTPTGRQVFHRAVGSVSSFGGSPLRQEIGIGSATRILKVTVSWPASHSKQVFSDVPVDSAIRITEGKSQLAIASRRQIDRNRVPTR